MVQAVYYLVGEIQPSLDEGQIAVPLEAKDYMMFDMLRKILRKLNG